MKRRTLLLTWVAFAFVLLLLGILAGRQSHPEVVLVEGEVWDAHGPVAGATVRFQGSETATTTDLAGRFVLLPEPGRSRLTAWKPGAFIAGSEKTTRSRLQLQALPPQDNEAYNWVDPRPEARHAQACARCHDTIYREWAEGGHARAATGRQFRDLYEGTARNGKKAGWSLLDEHPLGAAVCASCHAPAIPAGDPALLDLTAVQGVAALGVHCDYCHKIAGPERGEPGLTHGRYGLRLLRPQVGQLFFGPLPDVDRGEDVYSPFFRDSRYCASCHEGVVFGVPVYSTYSEWQVSPAAQRGQHCQDCHLKPSGQLTNIAPGKGGIERNPWTLGNHRFFAPSQQEMLQRALRVQVEWQDNGAQATAVVSIVAEQVGHRVPTGYIDRHLLLRVEGSDAQGIRVEALTGPRLPPLAGPSYAGCSGWLFGRVLKDLDGHSPVPFWRAVTDPVDTRLVPGEPQRFRFTFPASVHALRLRLLHRRFWAEVSQTKGWNERDILILERSYPRTRRVP